MNVLVTGGTGFVGSRIISELVGAGHDVVSLSRGLSGEKHPYPVRHVSIDLVRPEGLADVLHDVDAVVHTAGILKEEGGQTFERAHVGATENLVSACLEAGVGKIVYMSAMGVRPDTTIPYLLTKSMAEKTIETSGIDYTILRPSLIFGLGDRLVTHLVSLLRYSPVVPVVGPAEKQIQPVWVGDVAVAVLRTLTDERTNGQIFQLGGPAQMTFGDIVDAVKDNMGKRALNIPVPQFVAEPFLRLGERLFSEAPMTDEELALIAAGGTCDPDPAAVTFGLRMRTLADTVGDYLGRAQ